MTARVNATATSSATTSATELRARNGVVSRCPAASSCSTLRVSSSPVTLAVYPRDRESNPVLRLRTRPGSHGRRRGCAAGALDARGGGAHTLRISDAPHGSDSTAASERLARRFFAVVEAGAFDRLAELFHDDVTLVSRVHPGSVVRGRAEAERFVEEILARQLYEARAEVYVPFDASRIAVEGRMRWIDDERVIRDDPVVWALAFEDDLLLSFTPTRTVAEAETILGVPS